MGYDVLQHELFFHIDIYLWSSSPPFFVVWENLTIHLYYLVVSNIFYFHPYLEKWSNLTVIFQTGWNHQPRLTYCRYLWIFGDLVVPVVPFTPDVQGQSRTLRCVLGSTDTTVNEKKNRKDRKKCPRCLKLEGQLFWWWCIYHFISIYIYTVGIYFLDV